MKSQNVTLKELLPCFVITDKGGVIRIAELPSRGYLYLRARGQRCGHKSD
jgi:uncharacterized protein